MKAFVNGTFLSCEEENSVYHVLVEDKGRIVWLGAALPAYFKDVQTVDLQGATVVPALADTHTHFTGFALLHSAADLSDAKDLSDMGDMLREYAVLRPECRVILAYARSPHDTDERPRVTRSDLDDMVAKPVLFIRCDGRAAVCSSALLELLPKDVLDDPGCDAETGWLTRGAYDKSIGVIARQIPASDVLRGMVAAANQMTRAGVGFIHTAEGVGCERDADVDMMRICAYGLPQTFRIFFQTMDVSKALRRRMKRVGGCFRLALDGSLDEGNAAPTAGCALAYTQEQVNAFCINANRAGLQIALHAVGGAAVEQAIAALEAAQRDFARSGSRHIIIRADHCSAEQRARIKALGACVALQPALMERESAPPLRDLTDAGVLLSAGSGAPRTPPDPIRSMHICCNHPDPARSLTPLEALRMHTLNAAKTTHDEAERGSLTIGKRCDIAMLEHNPLEQDVAALYDNQVLALYIEGRRVRQLACGIPGLLWRALIGRLRGKG